MAQMPVLSGIGTLFAKQEIKSGFSKNGNAWAALTFSFQKSKKDEYDEWVVESEITVQATAFGKLAEFAIANFEHLDKIPVTIEVREIKTFDRKSGETGVVLDGVVQSLGAPLPKKNGGGNGGGKSSSSQRGDDIYG